MLTYEGELKPDALVQGVVWGKVVRHDSVPVTFVVE